MRDIAITLIVIGLIPAILMRAHIGVLAWSWMAYMNPHRLTYGFAYSAPFSMIIGLTTIAAFLFSREPKHIPIMPMTVVWLLFVAWMSFTTLFALVPLDAETAFIRMIKIQLMIYISLALMYNKERLIQLVWVIVFSLGFYGFKGGIFSITKGGEDIVWGPAGSFIEGNNELALALIMTFPLMRFLHLNTTNKWIRWLLVCTMGLSLLSIIFSYSRGAFLAIIAMGIVLVLKTRHKFLFIALILVGVAIILPYIPDKYTERMNTIKTYEEDGSALGRINAWHFAYNLAKDRPIIGGGFQVFDPELFKKYAPIPDDFHDAHSIYFQVLAEHGFVGLFLFFTLLLMTFYNGYMVERLAKLHPDLIWARDLAAMAQVSIAGYMVGGAFLGLAYFDLPYHLMAIVVLLRMLVNKALAEKGIDLMPEPPSFVRTAKTKNKQINPPQASSNKHK